MPFQPMTGRSSWLVLSALLVGCGDDRPSPAGSGDPCEGCGGTGGDAGAASVGGSAGSDGGAGGSGASDPDAGLGGAGGNVGGSGGGTQAECGNGIREGDEACDGDDFGQLTCASFGFSDGALTCAVCAAEPSGCSGTELCGDGADNDGDASVDCADTDCEAACADSCSVPLQLANGQVSPGRIEGQLAPAQSSCGPTGAVGQLIFAYESPLTGVADVFLDSAANGLALSVREECGQDQSELACVASATGSFDRELSVSVTQGQTLFLVVESPDRDVPATFSLIASAREVACGDGYVDLDEECDDGNLEDADGCSNACVFQPDESEPNDTRQTANAYTPPDFFGEIEDVDDADFISVSVLAGQSLIVETFDLGDGACARYELDDRIDVVDGSGNVVDGDDDGGTGFCAALITQPLGAGTYYVRVGASGAAETFFYRLSINFED